MIWTAGSHPNAKLGDLGLPSNKRGAIPVDDYLRVEGCPGVWAIGDNAAVPPSADGGMVPPTAQAAVQEGEAVAGNVLATMDGREGELKPFRYSSLGMLVELGSRFAVNEVLGVKFSGTLAALFWRASYLYKLQSPHNRSRVAAAWLQGTVLPPAVSQIRRDGNTSGEDARGRGV